MLPSFPFYFQTILLSSLLILTSPTINNNIFDSKIYINKELPISRLQAAGHRFSIPSVDPHYEIVGDVYESQAINDEKQIYNISNYRKSQSCTYFKSNLEMNSIQGENLNFIALQSILSEDTQELLVIGMTDEVNSNERFLKIYSYTAGGFQYETQVSFNDTNLSKDIDVDIIMAKIDNSTLISDGNYLYRLQDNITDPKSVSKYGWSRVQGWSSTTNSWKGEEFLGFRTAFFQDKQLLMFLYSQKVTFYEYTQEKNIVKKYLEIENSGQEAFEDIQIGMNNSHLYIITGNQLLHYWPGNYSKPTKHELAGQLCTRIYSYLSTLQIICEYEKRNFVGEYFINETMDAIILNRFYTDIENYRHLAYVSNYFLMVGENQIIVTSNGVNRKILLDMPKNPYSERFVSFGIENILLLNQFQPSDSQKVFFAVGQDFIVLFDLKLIPAQIWCYIERPPESLQKNILIVRNTSQCEMNQKKQTLKSICINLKPVQIFFQHYEIESKMTSIVVIIVVLLIFVLAFLCLGCVFRQNMNYNHLVLEIKNRINKINKKQNKQMQEL